MLALNLFSLIALQAARREWFGLRDNSPGAGGRRPESSNAPQDHLGSVRVLTDELGGVTERTNWGPWGERLEGGERSRIGFTGHQRDAESGLHYSVHRYLDSRNGRWLRRDPAGGVDGANLYRYVRNRPALHTDPLGMFAFEGSSSGNLLPTVTRQPGSLPGKSGFGVGADLFISIKPRPGNFFAKLHYDFVQITRVVTAGVLDVDQNTDPATGWRVDTTQPGYPFFNKAANGEPVWKQGGSHLSDYPHRTADFVFGLPSKYVFQGETYLLASCSGEPNASASTFAFQGYKWEFEYNKSSIYSAPTISDITITRFSSIRSLSSNFHSAIDFWQKGNNHPRLPIQPGF